MMASLNKAALSKADIAARIPHSGSMCLLDRVLSWNNETIICEANNHRDQDHPLARDGMLDTMVAIEYAAQAMAVHGALIAENTASITQSDGPKMGYLASVRDVMCAIPFLHELITPLRIEATRLMGEETRVLYEFKVSSGEQLCAEGRAAVVLDAGINL
jgi:predicted hotdog family 3-hydroxylacyl-ACP dehydratase